MVSAYMNSKLMLPLAFLTLEYRECKYHDQLRMRLFHQVVAWYDTENFGSKRPLNSEILLNSSIETHHPNCSSAIVWSDIWQAWTESCWGCRKTPYLQSSSGKLFFRFSFIKPILNGDLNGCLKSLFSYPLQVRWPDNLPTLRATNTFRSKSHLTFRNF